MPWGREGRKRDGNSFNLKRWDVAFRVPVGIRIDEIADVRYEVRRSLALGPFMDYLVVGSSRAEKEGVNPSRFLPSSAGISPFPVQPTNYFRPPEV